jgi:amidase
MRIYCLLLVVSCAVGILPAEAQPAHVVKYHATINDVKYVYGPAVPVAHVKPGDIIETNTLDAFGNVLKKPGDKLSMVKGDNPLTGPFYVDGAQPGDTLAVKILNLQVDGNQGVGTFAPGFGALNETNYTPMLHPPLPEKIWFYPIDKASNSATFQALDSKFSVKIPLHPFFGCIGVAPAEGKRAARLCPRSSAATWTLPKSAWAILCTFR